VNARLLSDLLVRAAERDPDATAVVDNNTPLSYGELDSWSNAIAHTLVRHGVQPGDRIGLLLAKSKEAIASIYGILKAGAVYVPFDPSSPPSRIGVIAANAGIRMVCTTTDRLAVLGDIQRDAGLISHLIVDREDVLAGGEHIQVRRISEDLAYILYTSGSTGTPKGVMLSHRAALAFVEWAVEAMRVESSDRLSSHAPLHFDLSIFDLFAACAAGAAVVLVPPQTSRFPVEIRRFIEREQISIWYSVPSVLALLALRGGLDGNTPSSLRLVLFAGEVFPVAQLRTLMRLLLDVEFWNLYGPTETNVCTAYRVPPLDDAHDRPVSIGRAIAGDETFVVTDDGRLAQPGEAGVLYVRGGTVMSGYWNDPERTSRVLAPSPYHAPLPDLAYCTGDLVRECPDGNFEFLGRRDLQIKSRGYRIELGEIENALQHHPSVNEAAVVPVPDELVGSRIQAFVVVRDETSIGALLDAARDRLPPYMIPERIDLLGELPKTSTGKLDRQSLTQLAIEQWSQTSDSGISR
jgi:amino acid adenylation domain-containing protein